MLPVSFFEKGDFFDDRQSNRRRQKFSRHMLPRKYFENCNANIAISPAFGPEFTVFSLFKIDWHIFIYNNLVRDKRPECFIEFFS